MAFALARRLGGGGGVSGTTVVAKSLRERAEAVRLGFAWTLPESVSCELTTQRSVITFAVNGSKM